jgi:hypothetical protein
MVVLAGIGIIAGLVIEVVDPGYQLMLLEAAERPVDGIKRDPGNARLGLLINEIRRGVVFSGRDNLQDLKPLPCCFKALRLTGGSKLIFRCLIFW